MRPFGATDMTTHTKQQTIETQDANAKLADALQFKLTSAEVDANLAAYQAEKLAKYEAREARRLAKEG
jgi:hypothetical protein